jgi:DMSO/TMAO reductase YedYZ molybdopterin-dependent catalytic subunit
LVPLAVLTGLFSNTIGTDWTVDPAVVHGLLALAVVLVSPWKSIVVRRGLGRMRPSRWVSIALLVVVGLTVVSGLLHSASVIEQLGPLTIMQVHVGGGLLTVVLLVAHYRAHPVPIRRTDLQRREFLGSVALTAFAGVTWSAWEGLLQLVGSEGGRRRFTGSHETASFDPSRMPVTSWLNDVVPQIDGSDWTLSVDGHRLTLDDLEQYEPESLNAILDCTGGWYSEQSWSGVRLDRLLSTDQPSVEVTSTTGYSRRFPTSDLDRLWLVTRVGGRPLSSGHGFPARLVAPDRRGFWWVKWVGSIEPSALPWWVQLPFPAE